MNLLSPLSFELALPQFQTPEPPDTTTLDHLPNELLLQIFRDLTHTELLTLATVSQRLHHLAISLCFLRHNFVTEELNIFRDESDHVLVRALRLAIFDIPIRRLSYTFNFHFPNEKLRREFESFHRLASKLTHVEEVTLDFVNLQDTLLFHDNGRRLRSWANDFPSCLDTVVSMCSTLTIRFGSIAYENSCDDSQFQDTDVQDGCITLVFGALIRLIQPLIPFDGLFDGRLSRSVRSLFVDRRIALDTEDSTRLYPIPSIRVFHIQSSMLLQAPLCSWTIRILNSGSIQELSLHDLDLPSGCWTTILPRIFIPSLVRLSIESCAIAFADLAHFLSRHPDITILTLNNEYHPFSSRLPLSAVQRLTTISTNPEYIVHFLSPRKALPNLHTITILSRIQLGRWFDAHEIDRSLAQVKRRIDNCHLSLSIYIESCSVDWLPQSTGREESIHTLKNVVEIELRADLSRLDNEVWERLPTWLTIFPLLRRVSLLNLPSSIIGLEPRSKLPFIRSLNEVCTGVQILRFNDEEYSIQRWLEFDAQRSLPPPG